MFFSDVAEMGHSLRCIESSGLRTTSLCSPAIIQPAGEHMPPNGRYKDLPQKIMGRCMSYQANHVPRYRCLYVVSSSSALTGCKSIRCRTLSIERRFDRSLLVSTAMEHSSLLYSVSRFPCLPSSRSCVIFHPLSNTSPTLWRKRPWIHHMAAFISDCKGRSFWVHEHKRRG